MMTGVPPWPWKPHESPKGSSHMVSPCLAMSRPRSKRCSDAKAPRPSEAIGRPGMLRPIPELGTPGRSAARATRGMPIEPSACGERCSPCDLGAWKLSFQSEVNAKYMQSILLLPAYLLTPNHRKNLERKPKATHLGPLAACRALVVDSFPMLPGSRRAWWFSVP